VNAAATTHARGRLLLTLALGEVPEHVPTLHECRRGGAAPAQTLDGGVLDRLLRHYGSSARAVRLHRPRAGIGARRYDTVEQRSGVARQLRVRVADDSHLRSLVDALRQTPVVEHVIPDYLMTTPFDAGAKGAAVDQDEAWRPREAIRLPQALGYEAGDDSIGIGLADTGVALADPEIDVQMRRGFDTVDLRGEDAGGYTLVGDARGFDEDPADEVGHGTGCAAIMIAKGYALPPGGAGACAIVPARVLGAALGPGNKRVGVGAIANIDQGMKRLIDLGVKVINMSFGTADAALAPDDTRPHTEVVRYALQRGCILVAASGNSGKTERYYPAAHPGVIAVGAVSATDEPTAFSTRGDHVALCAPGQSIWTCSLDGYARVSGTSFAAPFVAAAAALLASRAQRRAYPLAPEDARDLLTRSARPFRGAAHDGCGSGTLDVLGALRLLDQYIDAQLATADSGAAGDIDA
jgi:subtilisin family serine protease